MALPRLLLILWCAIYASSATAHEFWIEAKKFQVPSNGQIVAELKNGQEFVGISLAYFDRRIARFDVAQGDAVAPVQGRMGDSPALDMQAPDQGLVVLLHETTPSYVTYKEWEKFQVFADHKDFPGWRERHAELGFADPPFKERYTRHVKALIGVGDGEGADRAYGMKTEFVALTNPYETDFDGTMTVQVLYDDAPRPDAQVEVFDRSASGDVSITLYRTDADGVAAIPVTPGHTYLFDAVLLRPITDNDTAVWDTYWAALTFAVPPR